MTTPWQDPPAAPAAGPGADGARRDPSYLTVVDVSATLPEAARVAGDVYVEVVGDVDPVTGEGARRALLQCLSRARRSLVLDVSHATLDGCSDGVLDDVRRVAGERGVSVDVVAGGGSAPGVRSAGGEERDGSESGPRPPLA